MQEKKKNGEKCRKMNCNKEKQEEKKNKTPEYLLQGWYRHDTRHIVHNISLTFRTHKWQLL